MSNNLTPNISHAESPTPQTPAPDRGVGLYGLVRPSFLDDIPKADKPVVSKAAVRLYGLQYKQNQ